MNLNVNILCLGDFEMQLNESRLYENEVGTSKTLLKSTSLAFNCNENVTTFLCDTTI